LPAERPWKPDVRVVARYLDALANGLSMSDSQLQRAVRLNYGLHRTYSNFLHDRQVLHRPANERGRPVWALTSSGHELRKDMISWLSRLFGETW
jgi:predicted transcriptional regulator